MSTNSELSWGSPLTSLTKTSASLEKLQESGLHTITDLVWTLPLRINEIPKIKSFENAEIGKLFMGEGEVISSRITPAFGRKGKGRVQLFNATLVVKDKFSASYINLRWFNAYPNQRKQLAELKEVIFLGEVQDFNGALQVVNPKLDPKFDYDQEVLIEYPTRNKVPGKFIEKLINKIPSSLWKKDIEKLPETIINKYSFPRLQESFQVLHGKSSLYDQKEALDRLIYEDFFESSLKVIARRTSQKNKEAKKLTLSENELKEFLTLFSYELTSDQKLVFKDILADLKSGHPMMRLIQGDVGCGKTTVAILSALVSHANGMQAAFMCPTETLALQHFETLKKLYAKTNYKIEYLVGSTKTKEKNSIYQKLQDGEIDLIIGTHSLFQESVHFKNLAVAIIDEQHKFGVDQRIRLISKGQGVHSLLMTATPIPRTLQLAQYGDLDISSIKTMPQGRKGIQTRIVESENYEKYLSFLKTRISLKEQAYIVVPAIEESETLAIKNVNEILSRYQKFFPEFKIMALHGQLKSSEKSDVILSFARGEIDILISTSVIEVGINVPNASVMSIYDPHRFGLSSLHQLRGRVGRGEKPGFCFLVCESKLSQEAKERLRVIEKSTDGFEIAEADLKNRGSGDLFGEKQSGHVSSHKLGDVFKHFDLFEAASKDVKELIESQPEILSDKINQLSLDQKISTTI